MELCHFFPRCFFNLCWTTVLVFKPFFCLNPSFFRLFEENLPCLGLSKLSFEYWLVSVGQRMPKCQSNCQKVGVPIFPKIGKGGSGTFSLIKPWGPQWSKLNKQTPVFYWKRVASNFFLLAFFNLRPFRPSFQPLPKIQWPTFVDVFSGLRLSPLASPQFNTSFSATFIWSTNVRGRWKSLKMLLTTTERDTMNGSAQPFLLLSLSL